MIITNPLPDIIVYTKFIIIADIANPYTLNIPFFCQRCGQCCRDIAFPEPKQFMKLAQKFSDQIQVFLDDPDLADRGLKKPCFFLQVNNLCSIYQERTKLCREWFPRSGKKCPAYLQHIKICRYFLKNQAYQVGVRELIYIGEKSYDPNYPLVKNLEEINRELIDYIYPSESIARRIWRQILQLRLKEEEKLIFRAINPIFTHILM